MTDMAAPLAGADPRVERTRPPAAERLRTSGAVLSRTDLRELGDERRAIDAIFRELPVVVLPGYARPMVRSEDVAALLERCTFRDGERVR